jgi:hypothetical protein
MKTTTLLAPCAVFSLLLSACGEDPIVLAELIAAGQNPDDTGDVDPTQPPSEPVYEGNEEPETPSAPTGSPVDESEAIDILLEYCGECHQTGLEEGPGINDITNIDQMIADDMIIPGDRESSRIYARMVGRSMPPLGFASPSDEEIEVVGAFIDSL